MRGKVERESSGSDDEKVAIKLLKLRFIESKPGQVSGLKAEKVTLKEMGERSPITKLRKIVAWVLTVIQPST